MATTHTWNITHLEDTSGSTIASWLVSAESSSTYDFTKPDSTTITVPFSGSISGKASIHLAITPSTTEQQVITAVQGALGQEKVTSILEDLDAIVTAKITANNSTNIYGGIGNAPLPWNVSGGGSSHSS